MKGNAPNMKVMMKLMARGPKAESLPSQSDTIMDRNMNRALTSRARPTFLDITFIFIAILPCSSLRSFLDRLYGLDQFLPLVPEGLDPSSEFDVLLHDLCDLAVERGELVIAVKGTHILLGILRIVLQG